jgi:AAA domain
MSREAEVSRSESIEFAPDLPPVEPDDGWLVDAADLLAEPDPGPVPWLVEGLVVDQALVACVGQWKTTKSYAMLELAISVVTGLPAFGELGVPGPGPVVFVIEESGRAALWRRLDALSRGRAIKREQLRGLTFATNERVKLDDADWQGKLIDVGQRRRPRLFVFDPLARMKAPARDENGQGDMAAVIEFLRLLRDTTGAAVAFVHHTGHNGSHMRGSSDLESVWETRLAWNRDQEGGIELTSEHREAEPGSPLHYRIAWDGDTRSMRFPLETSPVVDRVQRHFAMHPDDSANEVHKALGGNRQEVLRAVKRVRESGSRTTGNHPLAVASPDASGTPYRGAAGTGSDDPGADELERLRERHRDIAEGPA